MKGAEIITSVYKKPFLQKNLAVGSGCDRMILLLEYLSTIIAGAIFSKTVIAILFLFYGSQDSFIRGSTMTETSL